MKAQKRKTVEEDLPKLKAQAGTKAAGHD